MHLSVKSVLSAAAGFLYFTTANAYYLPRVSNEHQLYRRGPAHDHPSLSNHYSYHYGTPTRIYRRAKSKEVKPSHDQRAYTLLVHLQPGSEDEKKGHAGHSSFYITKLHSGKSTKYQAVYNSGVQEKSADVDYEAYMFDKKKLTGMDGDVKYTPQSIQKKHGGKLLLLGEWKGKDAGDEVKRMLAPPPAKSGSHYFAHKHKGCHEYSQDALSNLKENKKLKAGLDLKMVEQAEKFLRAECEKKIPGTPEFEW